MASSCQIGPFPREGRSSSCSALSTKSAAECKSMQQCSRRRSRLSYNQTETMASSCQFGPFPSEGRSSSCFALKGVKCKSMQKCSKRSSARLQDGLLRRHATGFPSGRPYVSVRSDKVFTLSFMGCKKRSIMVMATFLASLSVVTHASRAKAHERLNEGCLLIQRDVDKLIRRIKDCEGDRDLINRNFPEFDASSGLKDLVRPAVDGCFYKCDKAVAHFTRTHVNYRLFDTQGTIRLRATPYMCREFKTHPNDPKKSISFPIMIITNNPNSNNPNSDEWWVIAFLKRQEHNENDPESPILHPGHKLTWFNIKNSDKRYSDYTPSYGESMFVRGEGFLTNFVFHKEDTILKGDMNTELSEEKSDDTNTNGSGTEWSESLNGAASRSASDHSDVREKKKRPSRKVRRFPDHPKKWYRDWVCFKCGCINVERKRNCVRVGCGVARPHNAEIRIRAKVNNGSGDMIIERPFPSGCKIPENIERFPTKVPTRFENWTSEEGFKFEKPDGRWIYNFGHPKKWFYFKDDQLYDATAASQHRANVWWLCQSPKCSEEGMEEHLDGDTIKGTINEPKQKVCKRCQLGSHRCYVRANGHGYEKVR